MSNEIKVTNASTQEIFPPTQPVESVNGKRGQVHLTQDDIPDGETYIRCSKEALEKLDADHVSTMRVIDEERIALYNDIGGYYFSENNWKSFIGDKASGTFGCNRVYVERSQERGTYGMYALSYNAEPIYNAWYSKQEWADRFAKEHPNEPFREPHDDEYPLLDSVVQRQNNGQIVVPTTPLEGWHATSKSYTDDLIGKLISEITSIKEDVYSGTDGLAYSLSPNGKYYICTGLGTVPANSDIEIAGYYGGLPVTEIGEGAFNNIAIKSVRIPSTINSFKYNAFGWSGPVGAVYVKDLAKWAVATFESSSTPVTANPTPPKVYIKGRYTTDLAIPEGVTYISKRAFMHWKQFNTLTLPSTVKVLDEMAFQYCQGLESVTIPASVQELHASSFGLCYALKSVTFEGKPKLINSATFQNDTEITDIYVPWKEGEVAGAPWGAVNAKVHYKEAPLTIVGFLPYHPPRIITDLGYSTTLPESDDLVTYELDYGQFGSLLRIEGTSLQLIVNKNEDFYGTGLCENISYTLVSETFNEWGIPYRAYEIVITGNTAKLAIVCVD